MMLEFKRDFAQAVQRWDALWRHEVLDRPCTLVIADTSPQPSPARRVFSVDGDFHAAVRAGDAYLQTHAFLGEAMPVFRPGFGADQMAAFLGAPLLVGPESDDTSWSEKIVQDWSAFLPLKIQADNAYWQRMKEFHVIAEDHFRGRALISEIDMHSNVDMLEGLRGAENLLFDMIDCPELVEQAMNQARVVYRTVADTFAAFGDKSRLGTTSGLPMYDRGRFNRIQADFIALLNPELFRRFVLPALVEEAEYLDRSCFHLDGPDALRHIEDILAIEAVDAIEWIPGDGNKRAVEWPDVLRRIQQAGKILFLHANAEEVRQVHKSLRPDLLAYNVHCRSAEEGQRLLEWLEKNT